MVIRNISIDLETKSSVDIGKCGVYKYAESPDFDILLFGVSVDHGPITVYDLACGDTVPEEIIAALSDDQVTKWAYNANFERVCLSVWLRRNYPQYFRSYSIPGDPVQKYLDPSSWKCTLVWAAYNGLPLGLEKVGALLGFEEQKLMDIPAAGNHQSGEMETSCPEYGNHLDWVIVSRSEMTVLSSP